MSKSLNDKYKKIDDGGNESNLPGEELKPEKEKKAKPPKEKKAKEPKSPKEKKAKEPKHPKEKKKKKQLQENIVETVSENTINEAEKNGEIPAGTRRITEEIVFTASKNDKKGKKERAPKPPKEKKAKAPKEKKTKEPKPKKEKKPREPLTKKDFITMGFAIAAILLAAGFFIVKYYPAKTPEALPPENGVKESKISDVQVTREAIGVVNLIQSDIPDVFYGFASDLKICYFQYRDSKMLRVANTGSVTTEIDFGNETLPVTVDYVELGGKVFGIGLFRADEHKDVYFYNKMIFKLTNLPKAYEEEGKALLLATASDTALEQGDIIWPESFVIDLNSGKTERFLSIVNRTMDMNGAGVADFCMMTEQGYLSSSPSIPFLTSREYGAGSKKQDIFVKNGKKEELLVSDVYGRFFLTDGDSVIYMKKTTAGFDLIRKTGDAEETERSFYGVMADYVHSGDYILNKGDGKLYNMRTGEEKALVGFRMNVEMMEISPDGKHLVMLGTVKNTLDYQIHIFNLETGEYSKYIDKNPSLHSDLTFVNNTIAVYTVVDPNQGKEYIVIDVTKAQ